MTTTVSTPATLADTLSVVESVLASMDRRLPLHVSREDLASAGKLALVEALLHFEGSREETRAYCYVRVRGAVLDELRRLDPLARHTRTQVTRVHRARLALEGALNRAPTQLELTEVTGFPAEALAQIERLAQSAVHCSVDETDHAGEPVHILIDHDTACPARSAETDDTHASVNAALARLAPNHAHVLRRYYLDEVTLDAIAEELGVSKERVRQIREAAEKKLRADFVVLALWQSLLNRR